VNISQALQVAVDYAFTISGGARQGYYSLAKIVVLFIPKAAKMDQKVIKDAANHLKRNGIQLMLIGLKSTIDKNVYSLISSQPASKYLITGSEMKELIEVTTYGAAMTICEGKTFQLVVVFYEYYSVRIEQN
jgi:hypothetical protein